MRFDHRQAILFLFLLLLAPSFVSSCGSSQGAIKLDGVEVREYQGKDLSSVATDFRENSIKGPQYIDMETYRLEIDGLVERPQSLTYDQVLDRQHYSKVSTLNCVEGWSVDILWEGILVRDLLDQAGVRPAANTVIFWAADGYSTSFPLSWFYDKDIIMASRVNEVTLPPERGFPFHLVSEDKWGYKWIKWITRIELSDNPNYKGYWEKRGYNNEGDLTGSKYD